MPKKIEAPRVIVNDASGRRNVTRPVTNADREMYLKLHGRHLPNGVTFLQVYTTTGEKLQEKVNLPVVYEGAALQAALKRASRWLNSAKARLGVKPPKHIALALAAREGYQAKYA
jgi:hypothetical protein